MSRPRTNLSALRGIYSDDELLALGFTRAELRELEAREYAGAASSYGPPGPTPGTPRPSSRGRRTRGERSRGSDAYTRPDAKGRMVLRGCEETIRRLEARRIDRRLTDEELRCVQSIRWTAEAMRTQAQAMRRQLIDADLLEEAAAEGIRPRGARRASAGTSSAGSVDVRVGDEVEFGRPGGEKTRGRVVRVAGRTAMVETLETRGRGRGARLGARWRVPLRPEILRVVRRGSVSATKSSARQGTRASTHASSSRGPSRGGGAKAAVMARAKELYARAPATTHAFAGRGGQGVSGWLWFQKKGLGKFIVGSINGERTSVAMEAIGRQLEKEFGPGAHTWFAYD